jgi:sigma-54 specific flagellar transcriptional regulator A
LQTAPAAGRPTAVLLPEGGLDMPAYIADIERQLIRGALDETEGNKQQAARLLGLKRTTLVEKARRLL